MERRLPQCLFFDAELHHVRALITAFPLTNLDVRLGVELDEIRGLLHGEQAHHVGPLGIVRGKLAAHNRDPQKHILIALLRRMNDKKRKEERKAGRQAGREGGRERQEGMNKKNE
jgi:hypothetical protein